MLDGHQLIDEEREQDDGRQLEPPRRAKKGRNGVDVLKQGPSARHPNDGSNEQAPYPAGCASGQHALTLKLPKPCHR